MLDYFCIFTKGGTLLWALSFVGSLKGDPINTLIRACLLEERAAQSSYDYIIPSGGAYALKWSLNNVSPLLAAGLSAAASRLPPGCWLRPLLAYSHTTLLAAGSPSSHSRSSGTLQWQPAPRPPLNGHPALPCPPPCPAPLLFCIAGPGPGVCGGLSEGFEAAVCG